MTWHIHHQRRPQFLSNIEIIFFRNFLHVPSNCMNLKKVTYFSSHVLPSAGERRKIFASRLTYVPSISKVTIHKYFRLTFEIELHEDTHVHHSFKGILHSHIYNFLFPRRPFSSHSLCHSTCRIQSSEVKLWSFKLPFSTISTPKFKYVSMMNIFCSSCRNMTFVLFFANLFYWNLCIYMFLFHFKK